MEYIEIINRLIGLMLQAEEDDKRVELILDSDMSYDVAVTLQDELGKRFYFESDEDDFDYLLKHEDILSVATSRDDKGILYFLSETKYGDTTLESEADTFYIHENVFDKINTDRLCGEIVLLSELEDSDDEDYEKEIVEDITEELDQVFEDIIADMIDELQEVDEDFCMHCVLKEALQRGYSEGYKSGLKMMKFAITDILDEM